MIIIPPEVIENDQLHNRSGLIYFSKNRGSLASHESTKEEAAPDRNNEAGSGESEKEKGSLDTKRRDDSLLGWFTRREYVERAYRKRGERKKRKDKTRREERGTSAGDKAFEYSRKVSMELTPASCPTEFEFNE